ncbi:cytochrome P450 3A6-like [Oppia nitens]|uniref:cytochrome P450 3A6-like n=1 Tax=Oppia nitens TaxID=1686743 RepID=UPI0023DC9DA2|nr:cytochrome P450 3A6-like [Oppia nitens]
MCFVLYITYSEHTPKQTGVQTASVGLWTRLTKPGHKWEQDLYRRYGKCFGIYDLNRPSVLSSQYYGSSPLGLQEDESDMKLLFGAYSMEVIIQISFGVKVDALFDRYNPIIRNVQKFFSRDLNLRMLTLFMAPAAAKSLKTVDDDIDNDNNNMSRQQKRVDFLQLMLDTMSNTKTTDDIITTDEDITDGYNELSSKSMNPLDKSLSNDELIAQSVFLFIAGYETTATVLSITTYLLAKNPVVQEKLYNEIDNYFKHNKETDHDYDILHSLKYLDAVIMETMRLYPSAPFLEREASDDYTLGGGGGGGSTGTGSIQIRKGQLIHIPIYAMQHDEANFPDPDQYLPERFLADNVQHDPYVYLPFGAGPRNCLGIRLVHMITKLALANAVHNYRFIYTGQ